jgi:hypothetical protein
MNESHLSREALYDCVDGRGDQDARRHLARCSECREHLAEVETLLASLSTLPREISPPEWVWSGVARETLEGGMRPHQGAPVGRAVRTRGLVGRRVGSRTLQRAAAVIVLAAGGALGLRIYRSGRDRPSATLEGGDEAPVAVAASLRGYEEASAALSQAFDERASTLSPETRQALDRSLAELDRAIEGVREALARYPDQTDLRERLNRTYRWKIKLLERAVRMTTEL